MVDNWEDEGGSVEDDEWVEPEDDFLDEEEEWEDLEIDEVGDWDFYGDWRDDPGNYGE